MHPHLFGTISSYWVFVFLGLVAALLIYRFLSVTFRMSDRAFLRLGYLLIIAVALGFVFAFLFQMLYDAIAGKSVSFSEGGITFMGGLVGGIVTFYVAAFFATKGEVRKEVWSITCIAPIAIAAAHSLGRMGCFMAGCCYGERTDSWLGVQFPDESFKRVPTQLLESIFLAVLFVALLVLVLKFKRYSLTMPVYLFAYSVFRFVIEFWRGDEARSVVGALSPSQWQSVFMFACGVALCIYMFGFKRVPFNGQQNVSANDISKFLYQDKTSDGKTSAGK